MATTEPTGYEDVHGTYGGVHYGDHMLVLARSPTHVLVWVPGHSYWSGRTEQYGSAVLYLLDRTVQGLAREYKRLQEGGRLSISSFERNRRAIDDAFGGGTTQELIMAKACHGRRGRKRLARTVLVDGGGEPLVTSHRAMARVRKAADTAAGVPPPVKYEQMGWSQAQVERLMDACRSSLESANDEEGQALWRKLQLLRGRFEPRTKPKPFVPPPSGRLRL